MSSLNPQELRSVAIVAHVDHGKTTLVDALLRQTESVDTRVDMPDRVMDSMDLEREKGITILAKNTSVQYRGTKIEIVDTPGHADFGGEVERGLSMVDGIILLVDASEGPLPQTRFVLRKALESHLPAIVVINKVDRSDARIAEVLDDVYSLFIDLGADGDQIEFPVVYANAKAGAATLDEAVALKAGQDPTLGGANLTCLLDAIVDRVPQPKADPAKPLLAQVTNLDASEYVGRLAICRLHNGVISKGQEVAWCRKDGTVSKAKIAELYVTKGLERVGVDEASAGQIVALAGIPEITIGESLCDPDNPNPLPLLHVDEPTLAMTIGINTSPLAGKEGKKLTARLVQNRLEVETVGNISIRVLPTERPDAFEVRGRGELALAILVETMRREGFELTVGKPEVLTREVDGVVCEPFERMVVDIPEEFMGTITQLISGRKGRMIDITHYESGSWVRAEFVVPSRGLIGIRSALLTETRGTAVASSVVEDWAPWCGPIRSRESGSLVADRTGAATTYALLALVDRGTLFVSPGEPVYEGMIIGENRRAEDMDVNPAKERKVTNVRQSTAEELVRLPPPRDFELEAALEFISSEECVEVTPGSVRMRKNVLDKTSRARQAKRDKNS